MVQETLKVPRIITCESLEDEHFEVMQVRVEEIYLTPYMRYLADGLLPSEPQRLKLSTETREGTL